MNDNSLKFLDVGAGGAHRRLAVRAQAGAAPGLLWLGGYKSDMKGTKAEAVARWAEKPNVPASGSTIPATANPAAPSRTARSAAGWPMHWRYSMPAAAARRS